MNQNTVHRLPLLLLVGLALVGPARLASGSAFRVTPIRVDFSGSASSTLLTLINESDTDLRFQISAFNWTQNARGEMHLEPTEDIVFFPALVSLKPAEERKVRIGRTTSAGPVEKTYRVFFEELPPLEKPAQPQGSQVRILTKIGVPIFIAPTAPAPSGEITDFALKDAKLSFQVKNTGNVHFIAQSVRVSGLDEAGKPLLEKQREGWYLLSGDARTYDLDIPREECSRIRKVRIEVETDQALKPGNPVLKAEFDVTPPACGK